MTLEKAREALDRYASEHVRLGSFLMSVLANDLMQAVFRADEESLVYLREICLHVYNELPAPCHGTPEKVQAWIAIGDERGRATRAS